MAKKRPTKRVRAGRARAQQARSPQTLPSDQEIHDWVFACIGFYTGLPGNQIPEDAKLLEDPLNMDEANLADLAGTLRHGVRNYNANATVLREDLDDETVAAITVTVTVRIRGG